MKRIRPEAVVQLLLQGCLHRTRPLRSFDDARREFPYYMVLHWVDGRPGVGAMCAGCGAEVNGNQLADFVTNHVLAEDTTYTYEELVVAIHQLGDEALEERVDDTEMSSK